MTNNHSRTIYEAEIVPAKDQPNGSLASHALNPSLVVPVAKAMGDAAEAWADATREIACAQIEARTERLAIEKRAEIQHKEIDGHYGVQHHKLNVLKDTADTALKHGKSEQFDKLVDAICNVATTPYESV